MDAVTISKLTGNRASLPRMAKQGAPNLTPEQAARVRAGMEVLRRRHGWNNRELGEQLGVSGPAVSQALGATPKNQPSFRTATQVARLLDQDLTDLLANGPELVLPEAAARFTSARRVASAHRLRGTPDSVTATVLEDLAKRVDGDPGFDRLFDAVRQEHELSRRARSVPPPPNATEEKLLEQVTGARPKRTKLATGGKP